MKTTFVYALSNPDGEIRYIGKANSPKARLRAHYGWKGNSAKFEWLRGLRQQGLSPVLTILEEVDFSEWQERERFWIARFRNGNNRLLNILDGGDGPAISPMLGIPRSEETKRRISRANTGNRHSAEARRKMSQAKMGRGHCSVETRKKISRTLTGILRSEETKRKISLAKMNLSVEARRNISQAKIGIPRSEETKRKISQALKGIPISAEARQKISKSKMGNRCSEETKRRMSLAKMGNRHGHGNLGKKHPADRLGDRDKLSIGLQNA